MPQCNHAHSSSTADIWTKFSAGGEYIASFISDTYWMASLVDLIAGLSEASLGASWTGLIIGASTALLSAAGAAYSHAILNKNHQHADNQHDCNYQSIPEKLEHHHLTWKQKAALLGDWVSHTGDLAGPITFVTNLATNNRLSRGAKLAVQGTATLFGATATYANVRTCAQNMRQLNHGTTGTQELSIYVPNISSPMRS